MAVDRRTTGRPRNRIDHVSRLLLDVLVYAVTVTTLLFGAGLVVGVVLGGGVATAKYVLFVAGFLLFGLGAFSIQPSKPLKTEKTDDGGLTVVRTDTEDDDAGVSGVTEGRLEGTLARVPPLTWYPLRPADRLSGGAKVFVASLFVLGLSLTLETVLGVAF